MAASELLANLDDNTSDEARLYSAQALASLTGSTDGVAAVRNAADTQVLVKLLSHAALVRRGHWNKAALSALANLCATADGEAVAHQLVAQAGDRLVQSACALVRKRSQGSVAIAVIALLQNVCFWHGCAAQLGDRAFSILNSAFDPSWCLHGLASCSVSILQEQNARAVVAQRREDVCTLLGRAVSSDEDEERRKRAAECCKNMLLSDDTPRSEFIADGNGAIVDMATALVGAVSANQQIRDSSEGVRHAVAEALLALTSASSNGRNAFWAAEGPGKLQEGYKLEDSERVNALMESIADIVVQHGLSVLPSGSSESDATGGASE